MIFSPPENTFCSGDHVSWHSPLDNSESRIQHMLLTEDPQMQPIQTPFGTVAFLQVSSNISFNNMFNGLAWLKCVKRVELKTRMQSMCQIHHGVL